MPKNAVLLLLITMSGCATQTSEPQVLETKETKRSLPMPAISAIDAHYPLFLDRVSLTNPANQVELSEGKMAAIGQVLKQYYFTECAGDSAETSFALKDLYISTVQLRGSRHTVYVVLLKHFPTGQVNSRVLFFNNASNGFDAPPVDFNLHTVYDLDSATLKPSNLKKRFHITAPDMEVTDGDKDGTSNYKLTRLYHNGTANAVETVILKVSPAKIDTLRFNRTWLK